MGLEDFFLADDDGCPIVIQLAAFVVLRWVGEWEPDRKQRSLKSPTAVCTAVLYRWGSYVVAQEHVMAAERLQEHGDLACKATSNAPPRATTFPWSVPSEELPHDSRERDRVLRERVVPRSGNGDESCVR